MSTELGKDHPPAIFHKRSLLNFIQFDAVNKLEGKPETGQLFYGPGFEKTEGEIDSEIREIYTLESAQDFYENNGGTLARYLKQEEGRPVTLHYTIGESKLLIAQAFVEGETHFHFNCYGVQAASAVYSESGLLKFVDTGRDYAAGEDIKDGVDNEPMQEVLEIIDNKAVAQICIGIPGINLYKSNYFRDSGELDKKRGFGFGQQLKYRGTTFKLEAQQKNRILITIKRVDGEEKNIYCPVKIGSYRNYELRHRGTYDWADIKLYESFNVYMDNKTL